MLLTINMNVKTPLGVGVVDGAFTVLDANEAPITTGISVKLPVNETTRRALLASNCMTPRASLEGVWVFREEELEAAR